MTLQLAPPQVPSGDHRPTPEPLAPGDLPQKLRLTQPELGRPFHRGGAAFLSSSRGLSVDTAHRLGHAAICRGYGFYLLPSGFI